MPQTLIVTASGYHRVMSDFSHYPSSHITLIIRKTIHIKKQVAGMKYLQIF